MNWLNCCQITHIFICLYFISWNYSFWYSFTNLLTKFIFLFDHCGYNLDSCRILSFINVFKQILWGVIILNYLKVNMTFIFFKRILIVWHNILIGNNFTIMINSPFVSSSVNNFIILLKICLITERFWITFFTFSID